MGVSINYVVRCSARCNEIHSTMNTVAVSPNSPRSLAFADSIVAAVNRAATSSGFGTTGLISTSSDIAAAIQAPQVVSVSLPGACDNDPCNSHGACQAVDSDGEPSGIGAYVQCTCDDLYTGDTCDVCAPGLTEYPICRDDPCLPDPCRVDLGSNTCSLVDGSCTCSVTADAGYAGAGCDFCADGYIEFPTCRDNPCTPDPCSGHADSCSTVDGSCTCSEGYTGAACDSCAFGFIGYPTCVPSCDPDPCNGNGECALLDGSCTCAVTADAGYAGAACDSCAGGYIEYPTCRDDPCLPDPCRVDLGNTCSSDTGDCTCDDIFDGAPANCGSCAEGLVEYPECNDYCRPDPCNSEATGILQPCDINDGSCTCHGNYTGTNCEQCADGFIGWPSCVDDPCLPDPCNGDHAVGCDSPNRPAFECTCTEDWHGPVCENRVYPVTTRVEAVEARVVFTCPGGSTAAVCQPGAAEYVTYRVFVTLPDELTDATFTSLYGTDADPMSLPAAFNEQQFGSNNVGGTLDFQWQFEPNLAYDSWLTIGDDTGEAVSNFQMFTDIDFSVWSASSPLAIDGGCEVFDAVLGEVGTCSVSIDSTLADGASFLRNTGDETLVAQITIDRSAAATLTLNMGGTHGVSHPLSGEFWHSVGVSVDLSTEPEPAPEPEPEPEPVPVPMPVPVPVLPIEYHDAEAIFEEFAVDGLAGFTTYRLHLQLPAESLNLYTMYGDENNTMTFPPGAYQEPSPFGSDVGGSAPAFWEVVPSLQYDSWLTIGMENLTNPDAISSIGIDFGNWTAGGAQCGQWSRLLAGPRPGAADLAKPRGCFARPGNHAERLSLHNHPERARAVFRRRRLADEGNSVPTCGPVHRLLPSCHLCVHHAGRRYRPGRFRQRHGSRCA
eukprot:SAG22_NODE_762_length_7409_cov_2.369631_2_plen_889_part_00